jgi:hypothetical protein
MPTPTAPVREHAPWTIWLTAVAAWLRSALGLLMAIGMFAAGFHPRNQVDGGFPGALMIAAFAVLLVSIAWIGVSVWVLRRRRWARIAMIAFESVSVFFGGMSIFFSHGSSPIGGIHLLFGALVLIVMFARPSIEWCSK